MCKALVLAFLVSSALLAVDAASAATETGGRRLTQAAPIAPGEILNKTLTSKIMVQDSN